MGALYSSPALTVIESSASHAIFGSAVPKSSATVLRTVPLCSESSATPFVCLKLKHNAIFEVFESSFLRRFKKTSQSLSLTRSHERETIQKVPRSSYGKRYMYVHQTKGRAHWSSDLPIEYLTFWGVFSKFEMNSFHYLSPHMLLRFYNGIHS